MPIPEYSKVAPEKYRRWPTIPGGAFNVTTTKVGTRFVIEHDEDPEDGDTPFGCLFVVHHFDGAGQVRFRIRHDNGAWYIQSNWVVYLEPTLKVIRKFIP